jgi:hypothetical protein
MLVPGNIVRSRSDTPFPLLVFGSTITHQTATVAIDRETPICGRNTLHKIVVLITALAISNAALAQVGETVKEGSKATAETAKQGGDEVKAGASSEPKKSYAKAKARAHKAKAHHHAKAAKKAAENIGH